MEDKLKILNKETISLALIENFDFSHQMLIEIVETVWNAENNTSDTSDIHNAI